MAKAEGIWISGVVPRGLSAERAVTLPGGRSFTRLGPTWLGSTACCRIVKESLQPSASLVWLLIGFLCRPLCGFCFFFPQWSLNSTAHLEKPAVLAAVDFSPLFAASCLVSPLFAACCLISPLFAACCRFSPLFVASYIFSPRCTASFVDSPVFAACCRFSPMFAASCIDSPLFAALYRFNPLFAASCLVSLHRALLGPSTCLGPQRAQPTPGLAGVIARRRYWCPQ